MKVVLTTVKEANVKILGKIVIEDGNVCLKGRAVYQTVYN